MSPHFEYEDNPGEEIADSLDPGLAHGPDDVNAGILHWGAGNRSKMWRRTVVEVADKQGPVCKNHPNRYTP